MLVSEIVWIFLMDLHEKSISVVDFLPEPYGLFLCVDLLQVSGPPRHFARHVKPVKPSAVLEGSPVRKFPFILYTVCHHERASMVHACIAFCQVLVKPPSHKSPERKRRDLPDSLAAPVAASF